MSRTTLTTKTQRRLIGRIAEVLPDDLCEEDAIHWIDNSGELSKGLRSVLILSEASWLDRLVRVENDAHSAFFGQTFDLTQFRATLERFGENRVSQWTKLGLEPHFFPKWVFQPDAKIRGWKVRPESWFWQQLANDAIKHCNADGKLETIRTISFDGVTLLVDTRCKPIYDNGRQMFANDEDYLGIMVRNLRVEGKIANYDHGSQESRFGVSSREWDEKIRPVLEACLEFNGVGFRLERTIEANVIPQMYKRMPRKMDGQTDTWVWYEEFFGGASDRLRGGISVCGGLANVDCSGVGNRWGGGAVRPVGVLDAWSA